jgi:primosomal protein N' (replication factor Y)
VIDERAIVPGDICALTEAVARYYHQPPGELLMLSLPTALRKGAPLSEAIPITLRPGSALPKKTTEAQRRLLEQVRHIGHLSQASAKDKGFRPATIDCLLAAGALKSEPESGTWPCHFPEGPALTSEQQAILDRLPTSGFSVHLINGVTGSGKTEIYFRLMESIIQAGKQVLLLIPEINLTPQTLNRISARFPGTVATNHSGLPEKVRANHWYMAASGQACILLGTRSSVFTPMPRLGLIIIDEEHDTAFKQSEAVVYHARDVAIMRGQRSHCPVILGSATPSLESLANVSRGRFTEHRLQHRPGNALLPDIRCLPMRAQNAHNVGGLHPEALNAIKTHLGRQEKVLVYINRRGYACAIVCTECGQQMVCPDCSTRMTLHRHPPKMMCHQCELSCSIPLACPSCHAALSTLGLGTQRIESVISEIFPDTKCIRVDRDSMKTDTWAATYKNLLAQGPAILTGTQMLAKGHDFPDLTLVIVVQADNSLMDTDPRSEEQLAQLMFQVAGRAGRAQRPGMVLVQTRLPHHPLFRALARQDYQGYAQTLLEERQASQLPPWIHVALIRASDSNPQKLMLFLQQLRISGERDGVRITGPLPAPVERIQKRWRAMLIIQSANRRALHQSLAMMTSVLDSTGRQVRCRIDVDPLDYH